MLHMLDFMELSVYISLSLSIYIYIYICRSAVICMYM